jgi:hypothetical protein
MGKMMREMKTNGKKKPSKKPEEYVTEHLLNS